MNNKKLNDLLIQIKKTSEDICNIDTNEFNLSMEDLYNIVNNKQVNFAENFLKEKKIQQNKIRELINEFDSHIQQTSLTNQEKQDYYNQLTKAITHESF
jgi:hypothetical protein